MPRGSFGTRCIGCTLAGNGSCVLRCDAMSLVKMYTKQVTAAACDSRETTSKRDPATLWLRSLRSSGAMTARPPRYSTWWRAATWNCEALCTYSTS